MGVQKLAVGQVAQLPYRGIRCLLVDDIKADGLSACLLDTEELMTTPPLKRIQPISDRSEAKATGSKTKTSTTDAFHRLFLPTSCQVITVNESYPTWSVVTKRREFCNGRGP